MDFIKTEIEGVYILEPKIFFDSRGYFFESFRKEQFDEIIGNIDFVQDNQSASVRGVIRGLHFQKGEDAQAKLVRCILGTVLDVALDIRVGSPTYGKYVMVELSADNHRQLFIPRGFAHGFAVLSEKAVFQYKCDNYYCPAAESGFNPISPSLAIDWHIPQNEMILSDKDKALPDFLANL